MSVFLHLLTQGRDLLDPLVVHAGHAQVVQRVAQGHQVVDVVIVFGTDHNVHHLVKDGALLHRRFRGSSLDVVFDLFRYLIHAIHVADLLPYLLLILPDVPVRVNLLGEQVGYNLHRTLPEDVLLEDVCERSLRIHGEDQHPVSLLRQPIGRSGREGGLSQPALAAEHDVAAFRVLSKDSCE